MFTATLIISIISFVIMVGIVVYLIYASRYINETLPNKIIQMGKGHVMTGRREEKKLFELIKEETTDLIINENPEMLKAFPKSTEFALDKDLAPQFAGSLTSMFAPVLGNILSQQVDNPIASALIGNVVNNEAALQVIQNIFSRIFGGQRKTSAKKKIVPKPHEKGQSEPTDKKAINPANFPSYT